MWMDWSRTGGRTGQIGGLPFCVYSFLLRHSETSYPSICLYCIYIIRQLLVQYIHIQTVYLTHMHGKKEDGLVGQEKGK